VRVLKACIRCHAECRTCIGQGVSFCTSCAHYEQEKRCVAKCSSDYYVDRQSAVGSGVGQCKRCNSRCLTCSGPSAGDCVTCLEYKLYYDRAHGDVDMRVCSYFCCGTQWRIQGWGRLPLY